MRQCSISVSSEETRVQMFEILQSFTVTIVLITAHATITIKPLHGHRLTMSLNNEHLERGKSC